MGGELGQRQDRGFLVTGFLQARPELLNCSMQQLLWAQLFCDPTNSMVATSRFWACPVLACATHRCISRKC